MGSGEVGATLLITDDIQNQLRYLLADKKMSGISLAVHPFLYAHFTKGIFSQRWKWFLKYKKWIRIKGVTSHHLLEYHFIDKYGEEVLD